MAGSPENLPPRAPDGGIDYLRLDDRRLLAHCQVDTFRASGPGGQKRNKTDSAVRIRLAAINLAVTATESRSQHENKARALRRLRRRIALTCRQRVELDSYRPSELLGEAVNRHGQLRWGRRDDRYPLLIREVLDLLVVCDIRVAPVAERIGVTTAALTAFLRRDAELLAAVNALRRDRGLKPIH